MDDPYDQEPAQKSEPAKNGKLLSLLLSSGGDVSVKLITLVLVVVTGGGNFFATNHLSNQEREDRDRAIREIHSVHDSIFEAIKRQKELEDTLDDIKRRLNR
jgi:hypothetical protein